MHCHVILVPLILTCCLTGLVSSANETPQQYFASAKAELNRAKAKVNIYSKAKNVVLMVGDGLGLPTVTASRIWKGQQNGQSGEEFQLVYETFPNVGLAKTYNSDFQVADSAGTATALMSGLKTRKATVGVDSTVELATTSCKDYDKKHDVQTVLDVALAAGKSVGIVTNTRITHATPASAYAHSPNRDWEYAGYMKDFTDCGHVKDIALQLIEDNPGIQVILGGGRRNFLNSTTLDPETNSVHKAHREGPSLVQMWMDDKKARNKAHHYVTNKGQFEAVDTSSTDYLLGLFAPSHMDYELKRDTSPSGEPSLTEMTSTAIKILRKNPKGYFLLVEGGRIDHAHHFNFAKLALSEAAEFDNAVQAVQTLSSEKDTLTVVTADHSHVFNIAGYPTRGNDILGLVDFVVPNEAPEDGLPYATLAYVNGPVDGRTDLTGVDTKTDDYQVPGCIKMPWETHGGEDVGIYAKGPMSHMVHTTHEQHYIAHVMMYAACLGEYAGAECDLTERLYKQHSLDSSDTCGTSIFGPSTILIFVCILLRSIMTHF